MWLKALLQTLSEVSVAGMHSKRSPESPPCCATSFTQILELKNEPENCGPLCLCYLSLHVYVCIFKKKTDSVPACLMYSGPQTLLFPSDLFTV